MKLHHFLMALAFVVFVQASVLHAFQIILPPPNDVNWSNVKANFDAIQTKRVSYPPSRTSYVFDFPCNTTEAVLASINTQTSVEINFVEPLGNSVNIGLNGAPATTLEISLFTILNK